MVNQIMMMITKMVTMMIIFVSEKSNNCNYRVTRWSALTQCQCRHQLKILMRRKRLSHHIHIIVIILMVIIFIIFLITIVLLIICIFSFHVHDCQVLFTVKIVFIFILPSLYRGILVTYLCCHKVIEYY